MAADTKERDFIAFKRLFREIQLQTDVGLKLHKMKRTDWDRQFYAVYKELSLLIDPVQEYQEVMAKRCSDYDFVDSSGSRVKGNGYRSLLYVLEKLLERILSCLQKCARERGGMFYSYADHLSTLTAMTRAMQGMELMGENAIRLMDGTPPPVLMNDGDVTEALMLLACTEDPARDAFYGRCLGFQYSQNLKPILQFLAISMASYEEWHSSNKEDPVKELLNSLWKGSKYLQHPTQRGIKIAQVTENPNIFFAKAFWSLTEREAITVAVKFVSQTVDVSKLIEIPAKNLTVKGLNDEEVSMTPPFSDIGYKPISALLISFKWRAGQPSPSYGRKPNPAPQSDSLIIHLHGGGFVAQSPKSHESYLRWWSRELDCPILSIDYSLAPEAPFPRALEECVFVYAWALNNLESLGTTGEKIYFAGDSAGGNLVLTTTMKLKTLGLRLPDHIFSYYPATIVRSCATPSRFLSIIDPLLPCGIMISCLQAYTGKVPDEALIQRRNELRKKILLAKGYILPMVEKNEKGSGQSGGAKSTFQKLTSMGKSLTKSSPSSSSGGGSRPPPPSRPPLPKSISVESGTASSSISSSGSVSGKPKPQRPPPPKAGSVKPPKPADPESVSFSSVTESVAENESGDVVTQDRNETTTAATTDESQNETVTAQEIKNDEDDEEGGGNSSQCPDLTEVDLTATFAQFKIDSQGDVDDNVTEKEEDGDTLAPLQSVPPQPDSTTSDDTSTTQSSSVPPKDHTGTFNPTSSVAVFFPDTQTTCSADSPELRLGRRIPAKCDKLSDEEVETLARELLDTFRDSETTKDPFMSPSLAPDNLLKGLPPIDIIACSLDPLLDDGITFAQRLKSVDQQVSLTILEGISHGFLCLTGADNVVQAQVKCMKLMKSIMFPPSTRLSKQNVTD